MAERTNNWMVWYVALTTLIRVAPDDESFGQWVFTAIRLADEKLGRPDDARNIASARFDHFIVLLGGAKWIAEKMTEDGAWHFLFNVARQRYNQSRDSIVRAAAASQSALISPLQRLITVEVNHPEHQAQLARYHWRA